MPTSLRDQLLEAGGRVVDEPQEQKDIVHVQAIVDGMKEENPPEQKSFRDRLLAGGGKIVSPPTGDTLKPVTPGKPAAEKQGAKADKPKETTAQQLAREYVDMQKDLQFIQTAVPEDHPNRKGLEDDLVSRFVDHKARAREFELERTLNQGGLFQPKGKDTWQTLRRVDEAMNRFGGTLMASVARMTGQTEKADFIAESLNQLNAYNNVLDRNTILGEKYGPVVGNLISSLTNTTVSAVSTGGLSGVAGMIGLDDFNTGMEESKGLTPWNQFRHATTKSAIGFGTCLAGGALASKAGVASGESLIPFVGKTTNSLFATSRLGKTALAATMEGGETAVENLLKSINAVSTGQNPHAADHLWADLMKNFSTGAVAGTVAQLGQDAGHYATDVQHFNGLVKGWIKRLRKSNEVPRAKAPGVVSKRKASHVVDEKGNLIARSAIESDFEALGHLEAEIDARYKDGDAKELRQLIVEQTDAIKGTADEIKALHAERAPLLDSSVKGEKSNKIKNLDKRINTLRKYRKEVKEKLAANKEDMAAWKKEYDGIFKEEKDYVASELERVSRQSELPNATEAAIKALAAETKAKDAGSTKSEKAGDEKAAKADTKGDQAESGKTPPAEPVEPKVESEGTEPRTPNGHPIVKEFGPESRRGRQQDVRKVLKTLGVEQPKKRASVTDEEAFTAAREQGLPAKALDMAQDVMDNGRQLNDIEVAGLQTRYATTLDSMSALAHRLEKLEDMGSREAESLLNEYDQHATDVELMSEAWLKSSSNVGAALQAQKRAYGHLFSAQRAIAKARRLKGEALDAGEVSALQKKADAVQEAAAEAAKYEKGTEEFNRADWALSEAQMDYDFTIKNMEPSSGIMDAVETVNAGLMEMTLSGDLVPLGRQGYLPMLMHPITTAKTVPTFFKTLLHKSADEADFAGFLQERKLTEMDNYKKLTTEYEVPIIRKDTPFSEGEASGAGRLQTMVRKYTGFKRLPLSQFSTAYRVWLNTIRMTMADIAYRQNKSILQKKGGKQEMKSIIDWTMNTTGHTKAGLGKPGRVMLTAPRWMLSRIYVPVKAFKHLPMGFIDTVMRKQSASRYIAHQYARMFTGYLAFSALEQTVASVIYGPENVKVDRDMTSPTGGSMTIGKLVYDQIGGMSFALRNMMRLAHGTVEVFKGKDNLRDIDATQILGATLGGRASPVARIGTYFAQSGTPIGSHEKMAMGEFALRSSTFLNLQSTYDALRAEGWSAAAAAAILESFGQGGHPINKRNTKQHSKQKRRAHRF